MVTISNISVVGQHTSMRVEFEPSDIRAATRTKERHIVARGALARLIYMRFVREYATDGPFAVHSPPDPEIIVSDFAVQKWHTYAVFNTGAVW